MCVCVRLPVVRDKNIEKYTKFVFISLQISTEIKSVCTFHKLCLDSVYKVIYMYIYDGI